MAGEPAAINGMDSACLPNLLLVLYFLNEDVGKDKPSPWLSDICGCGISQELLADNQEIPERNDNLGIHMTAGQNYRFGPGAVV